MMRAGWWVWFAVPLVLTAPVAAAPRPEDKSALTQVAATAPLVIYIHGVEGSAGRLVTYIKNSLPEKAPFADGAIKAFLENGFDDRKLRGLAKDGPIFVAFSEMPQPGEKPRIALIAAVTDYKAFRDNILKEDERKELKKSRKGYEESKFDDNPVYFVDRKNYVVLTHDEKTAIAYAKAQPGLDTKISKDQADRLLTSDIGIFLNMDVVNKDYAEQLKAAKEEAEGQLKSIELLVGKQQRGILVALRQLIDPAFQAIQDSQAVVFTVEFRPTALVFHAEGEVRANTKTATLFKGFQPISLAALDRLPSGKVSYFGTMANAELLRLFGPMAVNTMPDPDNKNAKTIADALEELKKAGPGARIEANSLPHSGIQTWQFAQPARALDAQLQILQSLGKGDVYGNFGPIGFAILKEKPILKRSAGKFQSVDFHSLTLSWDLEKMAEAAGQVLGEDAQKQLLASYRHLLGEKTTLWFGADDKSLITVAGADWKTAQAMLEKNAAATDSVGKKKGYQEARKELPAQPIAVGLIDIVAHSTAMVELSKPFLAVVGLVLPDKFPAKLPRDDPSFIGSAVTLNDRTLAVDLVVTATSVRDIYKAFILPLISGF